MLPIPASVLALHIPDGFLNAGVAVVAWLLALLALGLALRNARDLFDERLVPLAGVMAAFIFAAQMINFPVAGGTSGHFVGATLAFIVLGPWLGIVAMSAVIILQALLFQDGGLVVMGANLLVMAVVPGFIGWQLVRWFGGSSPTVTRRRLVGVAVASWVSIMAAALITALLLAFSGTSNLGVVAPAMLGVHALIGIGEALITVAALSFIQQTRPALLQPGRDVGRGRWVIGGLIVALVVVLFAPFASGHPDGLEWVAETTGFLGNAQDAPFTLLPDYTLPGVTNAALSTILAGVVGALVVAGVAYGISQLTRRR